MKKLILPSVAIFILAFYACNNNTSENKGTSSNRADSSSLSKPQAKEIYTCPMDTDVRSDKPGTCPKCGMDLVKKGN